MKKLTQKQLISWLFFELNKTTGILNDIDLDELHEFNDDLAFNLMELENVIEWMAENHGLFDEEPDFFETKEYETFEKQNVSNLFFCCHDCDDDDIEYYMVQNDLWEKYGCGLGMLCIDCLEERIGRKLTVEDFTDCNANDECDFVQELKKNRININ
jgi:hypothetical protein